MFVTFRDIMHMIVNYEVGMYHRPHKNDMYIVIGMQATKVFMLSH